MTRIGVIGLGFMGRVHLQIYRSLEEVEIAGICSPSGRNFDGKFTPDSGNQGPAESFSLDMSRIRAGTDPYALISASDIDLIDVCSPTDTHAQLAKAALQAGKHVICEKPLARHSAEARELAAIAIRESRFLFPAMVVRYMPEWVFLKEAVASQRFGGVRAARFSRLCEPPTWNLDFFLDWERSGGALFDLLIHDIDFAEYCLGPADQVFARGTSIASGAIDQMTCLLSAGQCANVVVEGGWTAAPGFGFRSQFSVLFEEGTLEFDSSRDNGALWLINEGKRAAVDNLPRENGYEAELRSFLSRLQNSDSELQDDARQAARALQICEAIETSIQENRRVDLV